MMSPFALAAVIFLALGGMHSARAELLLSASSGAAARKLLSCAITRAPMYQPAGERALPLCATQYFPGPGSEGTPSGGRVWSGVSQDQRHPVSHATAADLAMSWVKDPVNPRTDSTVTCSGEVGAVAQECWAGKGVEVDVTFQSVSCCSTALVCYIKSGGCVLR